MQIDMNKRIGLIAALGVVIMSLLPFGDCRAQGRMVDGIVASVGTHPVFLSDIQMELMRMQMQGENAPEIGECEILESVLIHNLLLDQADHDSIPQSSGGASHEVNRRIAYFVQQAGSEKELERRYGRSIREIRKEMQTMIDEQQRAAQVRQSVVKDVSVTPSEVVEFYHQQPLDSLPMVPQSYIFRQLVLNPLSEQEAEYEVRERLLALRNRILKGENFAGLATAYSEDRASAIKGGEMGYMPKDSFVKPFADAAVSLQEGQVSNIVKTEFGYHILQMVGRKGKLINVRHILLKPSYTPTMMRATAARLDSIRGLLCDTLTFEQACFAYSEDKESRLSGGYAVNPRAGGLAFDREVMQPTDFYAIKDLKEGEVSRAYQGFDKHGGAVVKIVKLEKVIPAHRLNLELDYDKVQELAKRKKEEEKFRSWIEDKVKHTYVRISKEFKDCRFTNDCWSSKFSTK